MYKPLISITDWSGGLTCNRHKGQSNQFAISNGIDFSSKPGALTVGNAFENSSIVGGTFTATTITNMVYTSTDNRGYLFGSDTKCYYVSAGPANVKEAFDSAQTGSFKGAMEYKSHLLFAQDTTIGNKALSAAVGSGMTANRVTGLADVPYHSMYEAPNKTAYICNDVNISSMTDPADNGTFTTSALALPTGWQSRDITDFGYRYTAIAANHVQGTNDPDKCKIFLWDRSSATAWQDEIEVPETIIHAIRWAAGYLWIWAGKSANLYVVPETSRKATKMFSFNREDPTSSFTVEPWSVDVRGGTIYFALSGPTADDAIKDVYIGTYSFPADPNRFSLNRVYARTTTGDSYQGVGVIDNTLFVSEDQGSSVYRLKREMFDTTDLHYSVQGNLETLEYKAPPGKQMYIECIGVEFDALPANCDIDFLYVINADDTNRTLFSNYATTGGTEKITKLGKAVDSIQFIPKIRGAGSGTDYSGRPFIRRIYATGRIINKNGPR